MNWQHMAYAPRTGQGFLLFGIHDHRSIHRLDAHVQRGIVAGDHWWAIGQWDVWREEPGYELYSADVVTDRMVRPDHRWVFCKDGVPLWTSPLAWCELTVPNPGICEPVKC